MYKYREYTNEEIARLPDGQYLLRAIISSPNFISPPEMMVTVKNRELIDDTGFTISMEGKKCLLFLAIDEQYIKKLQ